MFDETVAWGIPESSSSGDIVKDAIRKEQVIKCVDSGNKLS